jgi:hypothetical protein
MNKVPIQEGDIVQLHNDPRDQYIYVVHSRHCRYNKWRFLMFNLTRIGIDGEWEAEEVINDTEVYRRLT